MGMKTLEDGANFRRDEVEVEGFIGSWALAVFSGLLFGPADGLGDFVVLF